MCLALGGIWEAGGLLRSTPPTGVCCNGHDCTFATQQDCTGEYRGDDTTCDPNPCSGACCFGDGSCRALTLAECATPGGTHYGDATECGVVGACCVEVRSDCHCFEYTECLCQALGKTWFASEYYASFEEPHLQLSDEP